jgi:hypothetical protein
MRYKDFKIIVKEAAEVVDVVAYFEDGTNTTVENVPVAAVNDPNFLSVLRKKLLKKFNKVVIKYQKIGDDTVQGKANSTDIPITLQKPIDNKIDQSPDTVKKKTDTEKPSKDDDSRPPMQVDLITPDQLTNMQAAADAAEERKKTVDKNGDGKDDKTGEVLPQINPNDGSLRDPKNPNKIVGYVPGAIPPKKGGGSEGFSGDSGEQGEPGGGLNQAEAEDLAKQFYDALNPGILGLGTDEVAVVKTFKKIKNPQQLYFVAQEYKKKYGELLNIAIQSDYSDASDLLPKFNKTNIIQRAQLNRELNRLGYEMARGKIVKKAGD